MTKPEYWEEACAELGKKDSVMRSLIAAYPGVHLVNHGNAFLTLARAIVGQQISVKAAGSIWDKLENVLVTVAADAITKADVKLLRTCGLSERKVLYLKDLARFTLKGHLDTDAWHGKDESIIIQELVSIKGIGRWTAEMFLIFFLQRPNVYPVDDIGIQKAIAIHYYNNVRPNLAQLHEKGDIWQPWRTVASWYLWRSLDPFPVSY